MAKVEEQIKIEQEQAHKMNQAGALSDHKARLDAFTESRTPNILSKQSSSGLGQLMGKKGTVPYPPEGRSIRRVSAESMESTTDSRSSKLGETSAQPHVQEETLAQKKARLFKWNNFQNVKISLDIVKQQLMKNTNFIRFVSLFENFDQVTMAWGSNQWYQLGIYIQRDFREYYKSELNRPQPQEGDADIAYRELAQINSQADVGSD